MAGSSRRGGLLSPVPPVDAAVAQVDAHADEVAQELRHHGLQPRVGVAAHEGRREGERKAHYDAQQSQPDEGHLGVKGDSGGRVSVPHSAAGGSHQEQCSTAAGAGCSHREQRGTAAGAGWHAGQAGLLGSLLLMLLRIGSAPTLTRCTAPSVSTSITSVRYFVKIRTVPGMAMTRKPTRPTARLRPRALTMTASCSAESGGGGSGHTG